MSQHPALQAGACKQFSYLSSLQVSQLIDQGCLQPEHLHLLTSGHVRELAHRLPPRIRYQGMRRLKISVAY